MSCAEEILSEFTTEELMREISKRGGIQTFEIADNAEVVLEVKNAIKYAGIGPATIILKLK